MGVLLALLPLLAIGASPAPVSKRLPEWLVGTWCRPPELNAAPDPLMRWRRAAKGQMPQLGGQCMTWKKRRGRLEGRHETGLSGLPNRVSYTLMTVERGRLVYRVSGEPDFVEFESGPADLIFERDGPEGREGMRWVLTGDVLTIHFQHAA